LHVTSGKVPVFLPIVHPDEKAAIERTILEGALKSTKAQGIPLYDLSHPPIQNEENHFDFTLLTGGGEEFLDLVEVVLPGGYSGAPASYGVGDFADHMFGLVKKKSKKYGTRRRSNIHLLLYSTDWKFLPSESVITLFSLYCYRRPHGFKTVAVTAPIMAGAAVLWRAFPPFPSADAIVGADEQYLRGRVLHQMDPQAAEATPDGLGVGWKVPG
jgi:hypothetical protein